MCGVQWSKIPSSPSPKIVAEVSQDDRIDTGTICKHCAESVRTRELVLDTRPARFSENRSNMNHIDLMKTLKLRDRRARRLDARVSCSEALR